MYGLVDCNNFYASCERAFNPTLIGKPIVVLSNNDGCVVARSNEAKALGIPMGAVAYQYKELFEREKVHVFSSNYTLYGDMSNRVMATVKTFCPEQEIYSIDECFMKMETFKEQFNIKDYALQIRKTVTKNTGIPISIGIADTKALAKVANKIAKKYPKETGGVHVIDSEFLRIKALKWTKIEDVWGVGRQYAKKLMSLKVYTAYDFIQLPDYWVKKYMNIVGLRLKRELEGISVLELDDVQDKKNIACTRSFDGNYKELSKLKERVSTFAFTCSEKLRKQNSNCNAILVFITTNRHREDLDQYSKSIVIKTEHSTNSGIDLVKLALQGLEKIFKEGYSYKKAGVIVMDIVPENPTQLGMFNNQNPKHKPLMETVDKLNRLIGSKKVKLASQDPGRTWKMKQEKLSPCYSTRLKDVITVKC